ncbi:hypothetical protein ACHAXR_003899 [Thalassiosira sp. AJA248-18]
MKNSMAGMPIQLHNYDVILLPSSNREGPLRFAPGNHVGNRRFEVLLSLYRQKYLQANLFGDECECVRIAQEVLETVCDKCVPNGRIFKHGRNNRWQQFGRDSPSTIGMIRNALKNDPIESASLERSPKRVCRRDEGFELLCKAASKKLPTQDEFVQSPNPFDVVCESNGLAVLQDSKHTGNNRLNIMLDIRKKNYETSDQEDKQMIAEEVVSSIIDDASGNFLQVDKASGMYKLVSSRVLATTCIKNALGTALEGEKKQFRESEVKKLVQRKHKKAIMDRFEKRKCGNAGLFMNTPPPTRFNSLQSHTLLASKAA